MGKRGQEKKSCTHCIRRKVRCDWIEQKQEGKQKCTNCERRKQECLGTSRQMIVEGNNLVVTAKTPTIHPANTSQAEDTTLGLKGLDLQLIQDAFHAFYSSNCCLSLILIH